MFVEQFCFQESVDLKTIISILYKTWISSNPVRVKRSAFLVSSHENKTYHFTLWKSVWVSLFMRREGTLNIFPKAHLYIFRGWKKKRTKWLCNVLPSIICIKRLQKHYVSYTAKSSVFRKIFSFCIINNYYQTWLVVCK